MNIDFNNFFRLRVDITKSHGDLFHLVLERVDLEDEFYSSKSEVFLTKQQFKQLADYFKESGELHGII